MRTAPSITAFLVLSCLQANASELILACYPASSSTSFERFLKVDRIKIDMNEQKIHMVASSTGDSWKYENAAYNHTLDWFDKILMHRFKDGVIMASGIRAKATYSFSYQPAKGKLFFAFIDEQNLGSISFSCRPI
jgi:hypothetical protein